MKFIKLIFIILFWVIGFSATAQQLNSFKNYTINNGLPSENITNITQDIIGYLWFTSDNGISSFDGINFINYTTKNNLIANNTNAISFNNDSIFIATSKGISIKKNSKFTNFKERKINCILSNNNQTYLGTDKGILRVREDFLSNISTNVQIDLNKINDIKFDGKFYWIATNKALWKIDKIIHPSILKKIAVGNFTSLLTFNKNIIAATYNNGIVYVSKNNVKTITSNLKEVVKVKLINNNFWIVSKSEGITVIDINFNFNKNINKYNFLSTNKINDVFQDKEKNIWIATANKGIYKIKASNNNTKKPLIAFENIDIVYKSIDSININNYGKTLGLKPAENHISFTYKTVNINNSKNIEYRYKLGDTYSKWTQKNSIDFPYLQSGNYIFTAQSKIGKQKSNPIQFQFFIDKPIHQKSWFQWLVITLTIILLSIVSYVYIKRIKQKSIEKIRQLKTKNRLLALEQKALQLQMNPHFIFNVLNGIKALANTNNSNELNTTITKFASLLRGILHNSRQEEISLSEEINTLKNYIELEQQISSFKFDYSIKTNINLDADEILIPSMLLQPFVENSIKHAFKNIDLATIQITFTSQDNNLICSVSDNGIGYNQSKKNSLHNSVAINVTKERILNLSKNSTFSINEIVINKKVTGTKVRFKIPLKTDF